MSTNLRRFGRAAVAITASCGLVASSTARGVGAKGSPPRVIAAPAAAPQEIDGGWPRDSKTPSGGLLRIFQPQVASWDGQRHMILYAAVSYTAAGESKPSLGT